MNGPLNCTASELSIFLQGLAVDLSPTTSSDIILSVPSKLTPIASKVSQHAKQQVHFHGSPSTPMFESSTANHGAVSLMPSAVDFLVRTLALQAKALDSTVRTQVCGENSPGYLAKYDPDSHSLRTAQGSLFSDSTACLRTLPRSGSMCNGVVYQHAKSVPTMGEIVSGLLPSSRRPAYPTPAATDALGGGSAKLALLYLSGDRTTGAFVQGKLRDFVKLPSLEAMNLNGLKRHTKKSKLGALISRGLFCDATHERNSRMTGQTQSDKTTRAVGDAGLSGQLSPDWDEWLMGFPVGWTDVSTTTLRSLDWMIDPAMLPVDQVNYMARLVEGRLPNRKARVKAIGNAQVPLCAAVALTLLTQRFFVNDGVAQ